MPLCLSSVAFQASWALNLCNSTLQMRTCPWSLGCHANEKPTRIRANINLRAQDIHTLWLMSSPCSTSSLSPLIPHWASSTCSPARESWETVPDSGTGKSCLQEHVATHSGRGGTPSTLLWPLLPTAPPGVQFCLPAGPWLFLLLACPGLRELCARDKGSEQSQGCDARLRT